MHARYMYSDTNGDLWVATGSEGLFASKTAASRCTRRPMDYPPPISLWPCWRRTTERFGWAATAGAYRVLTANVSRPIARRMGCRIPVYGAWRKTLTTIYGLAPGVAGSSVFATAASPSIRLRKGCPAIVVLSIAAAQDGSLWIATTDGLSHMQNEHFHNYTTADGLSSDRIITVLQDRDGGIWAATDVGVRSPAWVTTLCRCGERRRRERFPTVHSKKTPSATSTRFRW